MLCIHNVWLLFGLRVLFHCFSTQFFFFACQVFVRLYYFFFFLLLSIFYSISCVSHGFIVYSKPPEILTFCSMCDKTSSLVCVYLFLPPTHLHLYAISKLVMWCVYPFCYMSCNTLHFTQSTLRISFNAQEFEQQYLFSLNRWNRILNGFSRIL